MFSFRKVPKIITGTVIDANSNEPLIAANISVPGSTQGSITDFDGNFTIEINDQVKVLEISYIGYTTQNLNLTNQTNYIIKLLQGKVLDEVLVIGYSVIKNRIKLVL